MKKIQTVALLLLAAVAAGAQVNINIDVKQRGAAISPTHYGIFFEEINHAGDGGLYAELIRNRSLDENASYPQAWRPVGESEIRLTQQDLLNDVQKQALVVEVKQPDGGVANEGFWGISAVQGQQYSLSLWVKVLDGKPGVLTASLVGSDGQPLGSVRLTQKLSGKWQKLEAKLVATGNDAKAHFRLTAEQPCQLALDVVSLFPPTYKNRPNGMRPQLAKMLEAMKPKFMRFPGGCYVEGQASPENAFRWRRTVGPIEERPGHYNANWRYWISDGMGFHEYLQLAEDLGAKPLYVVNVGIWHGGFTPVEEVDSWIQECMDALEYANGPVTSKYGAMRAQNGHPEPFNIEYLEIGNENANFHFDNNSDQSERYHERYQKFYEAIKAKYPNMNCIGNVQSWGTDNPSWRSTLLVEMLDEHYYRNPKWFLDAYHKYDTYDRKGPKIYVGEYAVTSQFGRVGNMNAAIGEAVYMIGMENNSDVVAMNSYAPIFVNENATNWPTNMIHFNSSEAFGTPSYWVQQLFPTHIGTHIVPQQMTWQLPEPKVQSMANQPVQVGISSWNTQAEYRDARLFVDGVEQELPLITQWQTLPTGPRQRPGGPRVRAQQLWSVDSVQGVLTTVAYGEGNKWVCPREIKANNYSYRVKARKGRGAEGFLVVFNYRSDRDFDWLNIGGWGNTQNAIEQSVDGGRFTISRTDNFKVQDDVWYDLRIDVEGDSMAAYINDKLQFTARHQSTDLRGVFANSTLDEASNTLYIKLVNAGGEATEGTINLQNAEAQSAEMVRLSSESGQDENEMRYPLNIVPRSARASVEGKGRRIHFPVAAHSINVISVKLK